MVRFVHPSARTVIRSAGIAAVLLMASPALAERDAPTGRYIMERVGEGMLRLDTATGAMSLCRTEAGAWLCEEIADERKALEDRIARLSAENAALREQLAGLGVTPKAPVAGDEAPGGKSKLPSERDVDQLMDTMEHMLKRFKDMMEKLQQNRPAQPL